VRRDKAAFFQWVQPTRDNRGDRLLPPMRSPFPKTPAPPPGFSLRRVTPYVVTAIRRLQTLRLLLKHESGMIVYVDYPCRQKTQLCHRNRLDSVPARNTLLIRNFLTPSTRAVTTKPAPPKGRGAITRAERPPSTDCVEELNDGRERVRWHRAAERVIGTPLLRPRGSSAVRG
jgi:hypothetical protein